MIFYLLQGYSGEIHRHLPKGAENYTPVLFETIEDAKRYIAAKGPKFSFTSIRPAHLGWVHSIDLV